MGGRDDLLADAGGSGRPHLEKPLVPPGDERASLVVGDRAQLSVDDVERLWFEVTRVWREGGRVTYHGRLRSVPLVVKLRMTDVLRFEPLNVLKVERKGGDPVPLHKIKTFSES